MSTISASTTSTTAYKVTADTTGTLVLQTGATPTTAVTIDTAQNMGLGVTPSAWSLIKAFQLPSGVYLGSYTGSATPNLYLGANNYFNGSNFIYSGSYAATRYEQTQGAHYWYNAASGTAGNTITFTQAMTLDSSGNLGVGVASSGGALEVKRNTGNIAYLYSNAGTGVALAAGNSSWSAVSDERVKDIIEPITNATNKVSTLRAVIGKYKTDEEGRRRSFLIAQDVQAVLPEAVSPWKMPDDETEYLGVQYTDVIPLLVAAIKEQQAIITDLTNRITALEGAKA